MMDLSKLSQMASSAAQSPEQNDLADQLKKIVGKIGGNLN